MSKKMKELLSQTTTIELTSFVFSKDKQEVKLNLSDSGGDYNVTLSVGESLYITQHVEVEEASNE